MKHERQLFQFDFAPLTEAKSAKVDATNGVIYGASIITGDVQARGHNLEVDDKTLKQMLKAATDKGQVSVKTNHGTGADAVNGFLNNFRIEGKKLLGDWHLLKTHKEFGHVLEMAERMPGNIGLSAAFLGMPETKDGHKIVADDKGKDKVLAPGGERALKKDEKKFARCDELVSVDLVAQPAANPDGLFEEKGRGAVDKARGGMANKQILEEGSEGAEAGPTLSDVMAAISGLGERLEAMEQFQDEFLDAVGNEDEDENEVEGEGDEEGAEAGNRELVEASALGQVINRFEAKLASIEDREQQTQLQGAFDEIGGKVTALAAENEDLFIQLQASAELIQELQAAVKSGAKPISHGGETMFAAGRAGKAGVFVTEFEERVSTILAEGKDMSRSAAVKLAISEDPGRYDRHFQEKAAGRRLQTA